MILFDGTNTEEWILNIERSFCSYEDEETMEVAVGALAGGTLLWYEWEHRRRPIRDWEELKGLIRCRFGSSQQSPIFLLKEKTEHKTIPLKEVTEEGYLGHRRNGLESKEWVEFGKLGLHAWDQTIKADKKSSFAPTALESTASVSSNFTPKTLGLNIERLSSTNFATALKANSNNNSKSVLRACLGPTPTIMPKPPRLFVCEENRVKMDVTIPPHSKSRYKEIMMEVGYKHDKISLVPSSRFEDNNTNERSTNLHWYKGPTLLEALDQSRKLKETTGQTTPSTTSKGLQGCWYWNRTSGTL
ncbi:unnamed protein product [Lactuca saligna]|uniref:Uncharacterized protein n=1 Tax=Lactuca saligna TaxID=75948 RepID=A0AA35YU72_LACSI|nr:unnamed protein product [Lactuca saligna]